MAGLVSLLEVPALLGELCLDLVLQGCAGLAPLSPGEKPELVPEKVPPGSGIGEGHRRGASELQTLTARRPWLRLVSQNRPLPVAGPVPPVPCLLPSFAGGSPWNQECVRRHQPDLGLALARSTIQPWASHFNCQPQSSHL